MPLIIGVSLALSLALNGTAVSATSTAQSISLDQTQQVEMPQAQSVGQYVASYFADEPIMVAIAQCESHDRQYASDGSVYRGQINNKDVGVMQINQHYQGAAAKKLGFDLYTLQGNVAYAQYLYEKQGTQPWASSSACWSKSNAGKALADAVK